ncbi:putative toxin-antitoxin system toxin component, PIN family (plasmid) [Clostridium botulinum]|uniref:putative toxin-antitoxin system toxin component, PIN family n=1 Tax=Clostridium botulinum TaxID=1491 RepID=UPI00068DB453|nr:putative toxin-antitoxin system toxin component, PIN family [Clostridium botulinum]MCD3234814.1 putative toxin-antitoxin system toxin component, PIN family [Clostridium botulinum D/C]MCD3240951.1 putative toxin-antitoxin system toxin component, PIN family [Clostridium botulinum D/C]MCD3268188.1 putative toxin-antitoxin system toxin component, PIN family [Clostridium botulinum D/C]MCD3300978.1 putative toxin-antitoxin system toxin component, PIN family [Clostridium botulinum D/C]MCD3306564.1
MKVVVDTNIFIGAFFENNKDCQLLLRKEHNGEFKLIMSNAMQEELLRIIEQSIKRYEINSSDLIPIFKMIARFLLRTEKVEPTQKFMKCKDPMDNMFFECAIEGNANYIISKDAHIHALKDENGILKNNNKGSIRIMYPDEFIMELSKIKLVANFNNR